MLGRAWREYLHPLFSYGAYPFVSYMKHDESIPDDDVTLEYMLDNLWIVGLTGHGRGEAPRPVRHRRRLRDAALADFRPL